MLLEAHVIFVRKEEAIANSGQSGQKRVWKGAGIVVEQSQSWEAQVGISADLRSKPGDIDASHKVLM